MTNVNVRAFTVLMALGTFVVVMDNTIMNVSIQALVEDLDTTVSGVQSAIALNALMMAAFVLFGGKLADVIGMRRTFMTGVYIYIIGSLLASVSPNLWVFIMGWCVIQGFGAALMLPNVQTIIRAVLTGEARSSAYGTMAGANALGAVAGPIIGGFLTTYFSWRWAFRLEVLTLLALVVFQRLIPRDEPRADRPRIDVLGTVLQATAMICIVLGILLISDYGVLISRQPVVILGREVSIFGLGLSPVPFLVGTGLILLSLFVQVERERTQQGEPTLVHLALFKIDDFVNGLRVRTIQVCVLAGVLFTVPLFMQVSFGTSAFATGVALLPLSIGLIIGASLGTRIGTQRLPRQVVQLGALIETLGALALVATITTGTTPQDLAWGLSILGFGNGLIGSQIVNLTLSSVPPDATAEASGSNSTLEQVGNSVGVAVLGTLLTISLSLGLAQQLNATNSISPTVANQAQVKIMQGVEVVSDQQIIEAASTINPAQTDEILSIYDTARTNAFRITMLAVAFGGLLMLVMSRSLPKTELAEIDA
jgi:MFS family permease